MCRWCAARRTTGRRTTDDGQTPTAPTLPLSHSFFALTGPAILEAIKPAEDGDGWIVRVYEPNGGRGTVTLRSARPWQQVVACNLVEENGAALPNDGQSVAFPIGPFEIVALRVRFA